MTDAFTGTAALVGAVQENADRLGLVWGLRPATVYEYNFDTSACTAIYDGDEEPIGMVSCAGPLLPGFRVMAMNVPPSGNFIISTMGVPEPGTLVIRLGVTAGQSFADNTSDFIDFTVIQHSFFGGSGGGFSTGTPDRWVPPVAGWYTFNGRIVWLTNATGRRGAFLNTNGTTSAPGTIGGQSLAAAQTGTSQIQCMGSAFFNGSTDYISLRGIQSSGAPLSTSTTDGGPVLEGFYTGAFVQRAL